MEENILKGKDPYITGQAFELHQRVQSQMGEFFDNWMVVGTTPQGNRVLLGRNHRTKGWGHMKPVYEKTKQWQRNQISSSS